MILALYLAIVVGAGEESEDEIPASAAQDPSSQKENDTETKKGKDFFRVLRFKTTKTKVTAI